MKRLAMITAAALLAAGPAGAQLAQDSSAPIDITADEAEVINSQCLAIWRGAAEALQARTRMRADVIRVYSTKEGDGCGSTDRLEAEGNVYYVTVDRAVRADKAVYAAASETITMTGGVIIVEGRNVARGDQLVVNVESGAAQMSANARGRGNPNRVRGVFYPSGEGR
ncbi:MAG TPA: LptA/OstA family protein [Caulobacteraceae bacterium]|nr:LptA/OstA family protein [Caulobacteraceae bacterium]